MHSVVVVVVVVVVNEESERNVEIRFFSCSKIGNTVFSSQKITRFTFSQYKIKCFSLVLIMNSKGTKGQVGRFYARASIKFSYIQGQGGTTEITSSNCV